jgi:tungstate transport system ATP-binding protein
MSGSILEIDDVAVSYGGRTVLEVPHLAVQRGEVLTLVGENGSGKTTLLRLLGLLIRPDRGRVVLGGEEVDFGSSRRLLELRRRMAGVMQEPLLCRMSVHRNVALGLRFRGLPTPEIERRTATWLERLSISHLRDRRAATLSGGEAQRTSLARAMALNPEVLFLDEPFAALDAPTRQSMLEEFRAVLRDSGVTAVFATHDRGEALSLGDRVAVLVNGRVAQIGSVDTVFSRPERVDVAKFLGIETLIPGRVTKTAGGFSKVDCGAFRLEAAAGCRVGDDVWVSVRPDEIEVSEDGSPGVRDARNLVSGRVTKTVPGETHYRVELDCGVQVVALVSRARFRELKLEPGRRADATFPARAAHLIRRARDEARPSGSGPAARD